MRTIINWRYILMCALFYIGCYTLFGNPEDDTLWLYIKCISALSFFALAKCAKRWEYLLFPDLVHNHKNGDSEI